MARPKCDGQNLKDALLGLLTPVDHQFQVAEVAYAETALAAEREDGNHGSGSLPGINGEEGLRQFIDNHLAQFDFRQRDLTVHAVLPDGCFLRKRDELKLERLWQAGSVQADNPLVVHMFCHRQGILCLPVAEGVGLIISFSFFLASKSKKKK